MFPPKWRSITESEVCSSYPARVQILVAIGYRAGEKMSRTAKDLSWLEASPRKSCDPLISLIARSGVSSFQGLAEARAHPRRMVSGPGQTPSTWRRFGTSERVRG